MLEMVVSLALFSVILALFIYAHFSVMVSTHKVLQWHNATLLARTTIEQIRADKKDLGSYYEKPYTVDSTLCPFMLGVKKLQVRVTWQEHHPETERQLTIAAGMYSENRA
jgi:type II secretory pathway component PulJ